LEKAVKQEIISQLAVNKMHHLIIIVVPVGNIEEHILIAQPLYSINQEFNKLELLIGRTRLL